MNYLARGLPPASEGKGRFTLIPDGDDEDRWKYLGIVPVCYPRRQGGNEHAALEEALEAWADLAHYGTLDHEQKIKGIVEEPVPLGGEELDYIERALGDATTTQFFIRYAKSVDWLLWIESKEPFLRLFQSHADSAGIDWQLSNWFAQNFVCEHPVQALAVVRRRGQQLGPQLWLAIARSFFVDRPSSETLGKWIPLLIKSRPAGYHDDFLQYILHGSRYPEDVTTSLMLFEHLTRPSILLTQDFIDSAKGGPNERVDFELATEGGDYWLRRAPLPTPGLTSSLARASASLRLEITTQIQNQKARERSN